MQTTGNCADQFDQIQVRHQSIVDVEQQLRAVALVLCHLLGLLGFLKIQGILNCDRNLSRDLFQQSGTIRRERVLAQTDHAQCP